MKKPRQKSGRPSKGKAPNFKPPVQAFETLPPSAEAVTAHSTADEPEISHQPAEHLVVDAVGGKHDVAVDRTPSESEERYGPPRETGEDAEPRTTIDKAGGETSVAAANAEVERLLRAFRKGLITEKMLEDQLKEVDLSGFQGRSFTYTNISDFSYTSILGLGPTICTTEREMVMHLLDEFRCGESFAAEFLRRWIEVSDDEGVRGGLRVVASRERYHAQILETRLRELGGVPQCTLPEQRREQELAFYSSSEMKDAEKIGTIMDRLRGKDPAAMLKPLTDAIDQIQEDQQSKELLRALLDDEMASGKWLMEAHENLSARSRDRG